MLLLTFYKLVWAYYIITLMIQIILVQIILDPNNIYSVFLTNNKYEIFQKFN